MHTYSISHPHTSYVQFANYAYLLSCTLPLILSNFSLQAPSIFTDYISCIITSHNLPPVEENKQFIHFSTSPAKVMGTRGLNHAPPHSPFWISVYINDVKRDGFHGKHPKQCLGPRVAEARRLWGRFQAISTWACDSIKSPRTRAGPAQILKFFPLRCAAQLATPTKSYSHSNANSSPVCRK